MQEKITVEKLAEMINEGFKNTASKQDVSRLELRIDKVEQVQKDMLEELTATHADVRYLRSGVDILTRNEAERDALVKDLLARVHRLEQKAGLAK